MLDKKKRPTFFYRLVFVFIALYTASSVAEVLTPLFTSPTQPGLTAAPKAMKWLCGP